MNGISAARMKDFRLGDRVPAGVHDAAGESRTLPEHRLPAVVGIGRVPDPGDRAARDARTRVTELHDLPGLAKWDFENEPPLAFRIRDGLCDRLRPQLAPRLAAVLFEGRFVRHGENGDPGCGPVVQRQPPC